MRGSGAPSPRSWINAIGLAILLVCYAAALWNVARATRTESTHDIIRIAHWQLEVGVRDGLDELIRRFEAQKAADGHPVKVMQLPIAENAYSQYVTTQMVGGTPPDMIELGQFPREFFARYFTPLSKAIQQPNAAIQRQLAGWESATNLTAAQQALLPAYRDLAGRPWMDTFTDGLRSQYNEDLQEYFGVGFSQFTIRMFYNKDLFRAVLGREEAPATYRQLLDDCARLEAWAASHGRTFAPIASSRYQVGIMQGRYLCSVTADLARRFDRDMDGWSWQEEILAALLTGGFSPDDPQYRAGMNLMLRLSAHFPRGFMALDRNDAAISFVQGRAAMITSGSWDACSFITRVANQPPAARFEVGVFDIPMPDRADPEFGPHYDGAVSEAGTGTGFGIGITRASRHADLCIEFLQFCTTPEANAILNRHAQWIPAVRGAATTELLAKFEPSFVGYWGQMNFDTGARGRLVADQLYWPLISGELDYTTYSRQLMEQLPAEAAVDFSRIYTERGEALPAGRARRSAYLALLAWGPPADQPDNAVKLLRAWDAIMSNEIGQRRLDAIMHDVKAEIAAGNRQSPFNETFFKQLSREMEQ